MSTPLPHNHSSGFRFGALLGVAVILGALEITFAVAYAVLLFPDGLSAYLVRGIGMILFGTILSISLVSLFSSYRGSIASGQDLPAVMLAVMVTGVVSTYDTGQVSAGTFATVIALISVAAFMTAALMLGLGWMRFGRFIRFVPFPVIGGLLAGTGWMLLLVSLNMMTELEIGLDTIVKLAEPKYLIRWLPGAVIAALLFLADKKIASPLAIPLTLLASFAAFHFLLAVTGISISDAVASGQLLNLSNDMLQINIAAVALTGNVEWSAVWQQMPTLISLCVLATVMALVQVSSIEVIVNQEVDMNRELVVNGWANALIGIFGGVVAYQHISDSTLAHRLCGPSRLVGVLAAAICGIPFLFGSAWLNWFPIPVLAGLILYLGIDFLNAWLVEAYRKLPFWEYLIVVVIFLTIVNLNFPVALVLGVFCGIALFLIRYSRTSVVGSFLSGDDCRSVVKRHPAEEAFFAESENSIALLRLKGFLFFGTAGSLYERVEHYLEEHNLHLKALVVDFRDVPSIDFTAVMGLARIRRLLDQHEVHLVASAVPKEDEKMVVNALFPNASDLSTCLFPTRDQAIEAVEKHVLYEIGEQETVDNRLAYNLAQAGWSNVEIDQVTRYFEQRHLGDGEFLIESGRDDTNVYVLDVGYLEVRQMRDGKPVRLRVFAPSSVIGEMSIYTGMSRSADVIARGEATVHGLSEERLLEMEQISPALAIRLHRYFASNLAAKIMDDAIFSKVREIS